MVKNSEIKQEFDIFSEGFKIYKELLPIHSSVDTEYWEHVTQEWAKFREKYNCPFCDDYIQVFIKDFERRAREQLHQETEEETR